MHRILCIPRKLLETCRLRVRFCPAGIGRRLQRGGKQQKRRLAKSLTGHDCRDRHNSIGADYAESVHNSGTIVLLAVTELGEPVLDYDNRGRRRLPDCFCEIEALVIGRHVVARALATGRDLEQPTGCAQAKRGLEGTSGQPRLGSLTWQCPFPSVKVFHQHQIRTALVH